MQPQININIICTLLLFNYYITVTFSEHEGEFDKLINNQQERGFIPEGEWIECSLERETGHAARGLLQHPRMSKAVVDSNRMVV